MMDSDESSEPPELPQLETTAKFRPRDTREAQRVDNLPLPQWHSGKIAITHLDWSGCESRFDRASVFIPLTYAYFIQGRLNELRQMIDRYTLEAMNAVDSLHLSVSRCGLGMVSMLISDVLEDVHQSHRDFKSRLGRPRLPWPTLIEGFSPMLYWVYRNQVSKALRLHRALFDERAMSLVREVQMIRVPGLQFEATSLVRLAIQRPIIRHETMERVQSIARALHDECNPYASAIATYLDAQCDELKGNVAVCLQGFERRFNRRKRSG